MILKGANIIHTVFGHGMVTDVVEDHIKITFDNKETKTFVFPDAFDRYIKTTDIELQKNIELLMAEKAEQAEREKEATLKKLKELEISQTSELTRQRKQKKSSAKIYPRENIAFKCNFCDGGCGNDTLGYNGVCSDSQIKYNIETAHHQWCTDSGSFCYMYYNGKISRRSLDKRQTGGGYVCYESQMLRDWRAFAGYSLKGKNAGKPKKLYRVQPNSLTVLTTRRPFAPEKDRIIFAVFLIDEAYKGNNRDEGYVTTTSKYKISLTPDEAEKMKFWNYYKNKNSAHEARWDTGLYRYFDDEISAQILRDISKIKKGTSGKKLAEDFFEHYCRINGVDKENLPPMSGALTYN